MTVEPKALLYNNNKDPKHFCICHRTGVPPLSRNISHIFHLDSIGIQFVVRATVESTGCKIASQSLTIPSIGKGSLQSTAFSCLSMSKSLRVVHLKARRRSPPLPATYRASSTGLASDTWLHALLYEAAVLLAHLSHGPATRRASRAPAVAARPGLP